MTSRTDNEGAAGKGRQEAAGAGPAAVVRLWASRGRAAGALTGFVVVAAVSYRAGIGLTDAALRGLAGAVVFSFVGWLCALMVLTGLVRTAAGAPAGGPAARRGPARDAGGPGEQGAAGATGLQSA